MTAPSNKTPPDLEALAVRLIRDGKTRPQVSEATGVSTRVLSRIARDAGVEFARAGSGSSGTSEGAAKARGYRSEYTRARREGIADRVLSQMNRNLDLLESESDARKRQALLQGLDAAARSYTNVTKPDAIESEREQMTLATSSLEVFLANSSALLVSGAFPVRPGLIQE